VALLIILFICGVVLSMSMAVSPALNAFVLKHVLKLIEAVGTLCFGVFGCLLHTPCWHGSALL